MADRAATEATQSEPALVLVVDDNSTNRLKMRMAVRHLGHAVDVAEDGAKALEALRAKSYDAVLLDIVMPEVDGFDVLHALKNDPDLTDIPVIVISALDDETQSVVRAIELGAEDFLPKDFNPVLLNARLGASLAKKRFRDQEREYLRRVEQLTEAAGVLESGSFSPDDLKLDALTDRGDALGRLAAVFRDMAEEIYARELRLKRAVQTLQGSFLVIAVGVVWGLTPALARMASGLGSNPLGLALWVNGIAGTFYLIVAAWRGACPGSAGRSSASSSSGP
ncbi:MAG: response regulator [Geminicoccaceae bacterium]